MQGLILFLILQMVIGYYPTMAGLGCPITNGVGRRFIMDDGIATMLMDGFGYPALFGDLPG